MNNIQIKRSKRRTLAAEVTPDERVIIRAPLHMKDKDIERFIEKTSEWINEKLGAVRARNEQRLPALTQDEIKALADEAKKDIPERVERFIPQIGVPVGKITIRNQKTRWGSCSGKNNLNFNCVLMLCPEDVRDYVVVHELSHLIEHNHSKRFWAIVSQILPDYKTQRKWLKEKGGAIISRLRAEM